MIHWSAKHTAAWFISLCPLLLPASGATLTIINGDPAGVGFNDTTVVAPVGGNTGTTLGQQRLIAFQAAANKWGATLTSSITIRVHATWTALSCSSSSAVLGSTGAAEVWKDFANVPVAGHWYGKALADKLAGTDLDSNSEDIDATFNVNLGKSGCLTGVFFYLGLDDNHGGSIDLFTVLLHELAHGLGFQTFTNGQNGVQNGGFPSIWDDFLQDNVTNKTWTQMSAAERMASAVNGHLIWNGSNVSSAVPQVLQGGFDSGGRPLMYAPSTYQPGSSTSHWDTSATPNLLMEPSINSDLTHEVTPPQDLTFSLLRDIGWTAAAVQAPDLTITKSHAGNFTQGQTGATYTITVHNSGGGPTTSTVNVSDPMPSGFTATAMTGTGWTCTQPAGPCFRTDALAASSSYPVITVTANVSASATSVTNIATVSGGGETNTSNDTASDPTTVVATTGPDLTITKTHSGNFSQGQTGASYTITVRNSGTGPTSGLVTVADTVPTGLTAMAISGSGWGCTQPAGPCTRSDALAASSSYPAITVTVSVAANAAVSVTNMATVSGGGDTNLNNNTASDQTFINQGSSSDLTVTITHAGSFSPGQIGATYTITVVNTGTGPTNGTVTLTDALSSGLTPTSIIGSGWNCTQPSGPCTRNDSVAGLGSYPALTLTANVSTNAPATVTNTVTVSGGGETNTGNDTASDTATIAPAPVITSTSPNPVLGSNTPQSLFINGSGFQSGVTVRLTGPGGPVDYQGGQVTYLSTTQLSILVSFGLVSGSWSAQAINLGGQSSNTFSFAVVAPGTTTTIALPHIVFGGSWYTALYFSNTTTSTASVQVSFIGDNGSPLSVPLLGIGSVTSQTISLNPGSTVVLEAPNGGASADGWVEATLPIGVDGYAVFRQVIAGRADQEAVVPFTSESSQTSDLTYDDVLLTTSVAFLNPSNQQVNCFIMAYASDGSLVGQTVVPMAPRSKQATVLKTLTNLSGIAGKRGRVVFSVPNGAISVLGLRFGGAAFTSIPVTQR